MCFSSTGIASEILIWLLEKLRKLVTLFFKDFLCKQTENCVFDDDDDFVYVASRRNEAAGWLRKMVGVVAAKDLPAEPSEEEFRLGLRSGIILCNVLNKVHPGAVPKVNHSYSVNASQPHFHSLSLFSFSKSK